VKDFNKMKITASGISKYFGEKKILRDINFEIESGMSIAITGPNGSGKTTLLKILCGLMRPTMGNIQYQVNGTAIKQESWFKYLSLVGPYLELYEELSAEDNLLFLARIKNIPSARAKIKSLMERVNLKGREADDVKTYSSGMRQRLKYVFALLSDPQILLLDEPTSNLDEEGIGIVYEIMQQQKKEKILIIATNERQDLKYGDKQIAITA
jgi:heme exporter protein A